MSIETQGHQVQIMPQYTALDPNRVTFDPSGFIQGGLSSINFLNELDKRKAYLQQQQDLAAVREGSLGAENARNLAAIQLAPERNIADIALAQQQAALAPQGTEVGLARGKDELSSLNLKGDLRYLTDDTARTNAMSAYEQAPAKAQLDMMDINNQLETKPVTNQLTLEKARQDLASITEDEYLSNQEKIARIRNLNASAAFTERNRPTQRANQNAIDEAQKQLGHIEMSIRRLEAQKVNDPNADNKGLPVPIQQYQAATRDANGKIITIPSKYFNLPFIGTPSGPAKLNPQAESVSTQLNNFYKLRDKYTNDLTAALTQDAADSSGGGTPPVLTINGVPVSGAPAAAPAVPTDPTAAQFDLLPHGSEFILKGKRGVKN